MSGRLLLTAFCTVVPIVLIFWYFRSRDVHPEPRAILWRTFLLGIVGTLPVILVESVFLAFEPKGLPITQLALYDAFLVAAIPEETLNSSF